VDFISVREQEMKLRTRNTFDKVTGINRCLEGQSNYHHGDEDGHARD